MNAVFNDYRLIWRVTTVRRDARSVMVTLWVAMAMLCLAGLGMGLAVVQQQADLALLARVEIGIAAFWLGVLWVFVFVPGTVLLNSPSNARLVPRQRRRMLQLAIGSWALLTAALAIAAGTWSGVPAAGLGLLALALMRGGRNLGTALFVVACNWSWLARNVLPPAVVRAVDSDAGMLALAVLTLPAGVWAIRTLYPCAGDRHLAQRGDQVRRLLQFERWNWTRFDDAGALARFGVARAYGIALRRACRRPRAGAMLMHALGPGAHLSAWVGSIAGIVGITAVLRLLLEWRGGDALRRFVEGATGAGMSGMVVLVVFGTAAISQQMGRTAGEQSLLRLTPLAGDAALLNRRLASGLLKSGLRTWLLLTLAILLAGAIIGAGPEAMLRAAALCCLAGQVSMMGLLGDYARDGGWDVPLALRAGLLALLEMVAAYGMWRVSGLSAWVWLAAIAFAAGAWQLLRGRAAMLAAPPAFPARRLR